MVNLMYVNQVAQLAVGSKSMLDAKRQGSAENTSGRIQLF
jgi:hypothetical protein